MIKLCQDKEITRSLISIFWFVLALVTPRAQIHISTYQTITSIFMRYHEVCTIWQGATCDLGSVLVTWGFLQIASVVQSSNTVGACWMNLHGILCTVKAYHSKRGVLWLLSQWSGVHCLHNRNLYKAVKYKYIRTFKSKGFWCIFLTIHTFCTWIHPAFMIL